MNEEIILNIVNELKVKKHQVEAALKLLEEGNTIPFIARYRKEVTGSLDEEELKRIEEFYTYEVNLQSRKEDIIRLIDEKGMLTKELVEEINKAQKLVELEDIYRPFKEKKKTRASEAIKKGLEPLSKKIMLFENINLEEEAKKYLNKDVKTIKEALDGASDIIAENISDNAKYRSFIRKHLLAAGSIKTTVKKDAFDDKKIYEMYYDFEIQISKIKHHNVLAINRAEKEKVITVNVLYDEEYVFDFIRKDLIKKETSEASFVETAISDSLKRLIMPSVIREVRSLLKENAEKDAIESFKANLEALLLTPPIKDKNVLGFDPAFRTGCKLAAIDKNGNLKEVSVIFPVPPKEDYEGSKKELLRLINKYAIDLIALGNGTASRESEAFIARVIDEEKLKVKYLIVSEAGASVYSASSVAIDEFPDLTVEKRSAVSIGRRVQDSLSELVKIDPKAIGVGMYQHDMPVKELDDALKFTTEKIVNRVGVNINQASSYLLKYVSGLTKAPITKIMKYKEKKAFKSREDIKKLLGSTKVYEQAIGFLRVPESDNYLDKTAIHPDDYDKAHTLIKHLKLQKEDIGNNKIDLDKLNYLDMHKDTNIPVVEIKDILLELNKASRDPRDSIKAPKLKEGILTLDDISVGDALEGTVRNVTSFGAFIDVGLHNDGMVHISKMSKSFVKDPKDLLKPGDIVTAYVIDIDKDKERLSLSLVK